MSTDQPTGSPIPAVPPTPWLDRFADTGEQTVSSDGAAVPPVSALREEVMILRAENARLRAELDCVEHHIQKLSDATRNDLRARIATLEAQLAEARKDGERLKWARKNCRVVFCPPDGAYPIEHAPHAGKDMWEALATAADTDAACRLDALVDKT